MKWEICKYYGHYTTHSKCNFRNFFEPLWAARSSANKLQMHVSFQGSQCPGKTKILALQDSLKLSSFIKFTVHPQICCFWCRWVDLTYSYKSSLLNSSRMIQQKHSNSDWKQWKTISVHHVTLGLKEAMEYTPMLSSDKTGPVVSYKWTSWVWERTG